MLLAIVVAMVAFYGLNIFLTSGVYSYALQKFTQQKELNSPANIQLTEIIDGTCTKCFNILNLAGAIRGLNITKVTDEKSFNDYNSASAQALIGKYGIKRLPALIITGEVNKSVGSTNVALIWQQISLTESVRVVGSDIVVEATPYVDLASGNIKGLVNLITLTDNACTKCYDVTTHKNILLSTFQVFLNNATSYDISSPYGASLVAKYNITAVPTILLSPEISAYPYFTSQAATQFFSVQNDGWYIFNSTGFMVQQGGYFNLADNTFVNSTSG